MLIRETKADDAEKLSAMIIASWRVTYAGILRPEKLREICSKFLTPAMFLARVKYVEAVNFVAVDGGDIVGHVFGEMSDNNLHSAYLYVAERHQGRGTGKRLLDTAIGGKPKLRSVMLGVFKENLNAVQFYQHLGFDIVGKDNPKDWRPGDPEGLKMEKLLR